jgi:hypothetical protein
VVTAAMNSGGQAGSFVSGLLFGYAVSAWKSYDLPLIPISGILIIGAALVEDRRHVNLSPPQPNMRRRSKVQYEQAFRTFQSLHSRDERHKVGSRKGHAALVTEEEAFRLHADDMREPVGSHFPGGGAEE